MKKFLVATLAVVALAGCQTIPVSSSNPNAGLSSTGSPGFAAMGLQSVDFEYAANQAVQEFLSSALGRKNRGKPWIVQMGDVVNDTSLRIDTASMTSRMKREMSKTGTFMFTGATGRERTDFVADSRQLSRSAMFDKSTVARQGTVIAPDLEMSGTIRQRTVVGADQKSQQLEYEFDFRVVERDTGLEFQSFVPIEKTGSNKAFVR